MNDKSNSHSGLGSKVLNAGSSPGNGSEKTGLTLEALLSTSGKFASNKPLITTIGFEPKVESKIKEEASDDPSKDESHALAASLKNSQAINSSDMLDLFNSSASEQIETLAASVKPLSSSSNVYTTPSSPIKVSPGFTRTEGFTPSPKNQNLSKLQGTPPSPTGVDRI